MILLYAINFSNKWLANSMYSYSLDLLIIDIVGPYIFCRYSDNYSIGIALQSFLWYKSKSAIKEILRSTSNSN